MLGSSATFSCATGNDSRKVLWIVWRSWLQNTTVFILYLQKYSRFLAGFLSFFLLLEGLLGFIRKQFWNMNRVEWLTFGWGLRWYTIFLSHENSSGHKLYLSFEFLGKVNTWTFNCKLLMKEIFMENIESVLCHICRSSHHPIYPEHFVWNSSGNVFEQSTGHRRVKKNHDCRECCLQDKLVAGFCPGLIWKLRLLMFVRARAQKNLCLDTTSHLK